MNPSTEQIITPKSQVSTLSRSCSAPLFQVVTAEFASASGQLKALLAPAAAAGAGGAEGDAGLSAGHAKAAAILAAQLAAEAAMPEAEVRVSTMDAYVLVVPMSC